ncbi:YbaK/EbsC family protein [Vibrio astriarenae]
MNANSDYIAQKSHDLYLWTLEHLAQHHIDFSQWQHEPILDFATDVKVAQQLGWQGVHSKSLFLRLKGTKRYAVYLTDKDSRLDSKAIKEVLGKRVSICPDQEMVDKLGCYPGAVCPFGLEEEISLVIDKRLLEADEVLYTPGRPDITFGLPQSSLKQLLTTLSNPIHLL